MLRKTVKINKYICLTLSQMAYDHTIMLPHTPWLSFACPSSVIVCYKKSNLHTHYKTVAILHLIHQQNFDNTAFELKKTSANSLLSSAILFISHSL